VRIIDPCSRHFVPHAALEETASGLLIEAAPLLEEERDAGPTTLVTNLEHPTLFHRSCPGTGFTSNDDPIDPLQIQIRQPAEQRLKGQELEVGSGPSEMFNSVGMSGIFDADAHPNVGRPVDSGAQLQQACGPLGQNLKLVPPCEAHHVEDLHQKRGGNSLMEEITHRVDKGETRPFPQ
jgi:hypothetical protein